MSTYSFRIFVADGSRRSDSDGSNSSSSEDERPEVYHEDFQVNDTSEQILKIGIYCNSS